MCKSKDQVKTKLDKLLIAMERLAQAIEDDIKSRGSTELPVRS